MGSQSERAYNEIRDAITYGKLSPGERLIEVEICKKFDLGRTPFREVLRQLQAEGYLDIFPNKGVFISKYSVKDLEAILDIVAVLEGHAVEVAVKNITPEEIGELRSLQNSMKEARKKNDYKKWLEKNTTFHDSLLKKSQNPHLVKVVQGLRSRIYRYRLIALAVPGHIETYLRAHEEILKYAYTGDSKKAGNAMRRHVLNNKEGLVKILKEFPAVSIINSML